MSLSSIHAEIASLEARLEHLRAEAASLGSSASSSSSSLPRMAETGLPMELEEYVSVFLFKAHQSERLSRSAERGAEAFVLGSEVETIRTADDPAWHGPTW
jgi:hypothetical protein